MSSAYPDLEYLPEGEREKAERARDCLNGLCTAETPMTNEVERGKFLGIDLATRPDRTTVNVDGVCYDGESGIGKLYLDALSRISALEAKLEEGLAAVNQLGEHVFDILTEDDKRAIGVTLHKARTALKGDDNE